MVWFLIPKYKKPQIIPNFISDKEIEHIKKEASGKFKISTIDQNETTDKKIRDSDTAWLKLEDPVVNGVVQRCASLTDRSISNCEMLQVLRYRPDGFYRPHQDAFPMGNKRMYTVILALNDDYEEGETEFPNIQKKYKLNKGDALFFHTLDNYGMINSRALHGGLPVKSGEKWICNVWVHKYPY